MKILTFETNNDSIMIERLFHSSLKALLAVVMGLCLISPTVAAQGQSNTGEFTLNIKGSGVKVATVAVTDLAGNNLCQGCELQCGSTSTEFAFLKEEALLQEETPLAFKFDFPDGAFSRGCTVRLYNEAGDLVAYRTISGKQARVKASGSTVVNLEGIDGRYSESKDTKAGSRQADIISVNRPERASISENNYHHYKFVIPEGGAKNFKLKLKSGAGTRLVLTLSKDAPALRSDADYLISQEAADKALTLEEIPEGTWYIGVFRVSEPEGAITASGIKYTLKASWK